VLVWLLCILHWANNASLNKLTHYLIWVNFVKTGVRAEEETPAKKVISRIYFYIGISCLSFLKTSLRENTKEALMSDN